MSMKDIPAHWTHGGLVLARAKDPAAPGAHVVGDPCIVWDEMIPGWRMVLFFDPPGHGQAICRSRLEVGPGQWETPTPLIFTNGQGVRTHKPYIVQEANRPGYAARVNGRYWLLSVGATAAHGKFIHRAWAQQLAGPWTWEKGMLIAPGGKGEFDEKHTDAVSGLYFPDRQEFVYFYMGYPRVAQKRAISPFGNAQAVAVQMAGEAAVRKLGVILPPRQQRGHWASGWVGGLQVFPGQAHRWIGLANASPTAPTPLDPARSREEPPPSLGGFAYCDEEFPVCNWHWADEPIEWIEQIPSAALAAGEGVNLWRHYLLQLDDRRWAIFYNTGAYGTEQMYVKYTH